MLLLTISTLLLDFQGINTTNWKVHRAALKTSQFEFLQTSGKDGKG